MGRIGLSGIDYYKSDQDSEIIGKKLETYENGVSYRLPVNHNGRDTL